MLSAEFLPAFGGIDIWSFRGPGRMSFDLLAPHYRWMEFVLAGNKLQACRTTFLQEVADRKNVLILGEGNGRFLLNCRRALASAHITCVDASSRMLRSARKRLARHGLRSREIEFIHIDALRWKPCPNSFDLIVTHFFLDCFSGDQLEQLIRTVAQASTANAEWLLADFQVPDGGWKRVRARIVHVLMYAFFRAATRLPAKALTCPDPFLAANGFALRSRRLSEWGLLHTDRWAKVP
jgi:ubiquinone/menaquinone biosynthesis C-methylase UbiE